MVVGAGPAGLAAAACLRRAGVSFVIVERAEAVAPAWRRHYDRLHLHTTKRFSQLPYMRFPRSVPRYPSREQVVEYLDAYRRRFDLQPRLGEEVRRIHRENGRWETETTGGRYESRHVVVALGNTRVPNVPSFPGQEAFPGNVLHSSAYRNGEPFRGKKVLVVGIGNSGAEIALDLYEHGAADIHFSVRGPQNVVPRDVVGIPIQVTSILLAPLPLILQDFIGSTVSRIWFGKLERHGLPRREVGIMTHLIGNRQIPLVDVGTVGLIKKGRIRVRPAISQFKGRTVRFEDSSTFEPDAVILATGYRPGLEQLIGERQDVLDERGRPRKEGAEPPAPGLFFIGYRVRASGVLRDISREARQVARQIQCAREANA